MASTTERRAGALMVVGATSGAGKSTVVSALCRALARREVDVAPFKAQNMSNHSAVTPDGGEIGRAQAMQALAARVETDRRMGPVLLKPSGLRSSHLVVLGEEIGVADALGYGERAARLRPVVLSALQSLRAEHDVVVAEGAGGAAEINLLERDLVNLPLAAAAGIPAVLVVDIERGGAFASAYGTWALLPERLRACLRGFVINTFRGEVSLLDAGLRDLERRTGVPVLGVLPHLGDHLMLGVEDSLDLDAHAAQAGPEGLSCQSGGSAVPTQEGCSCQSGRPVRIAVLRLPHLANPSDLDPLVLEPSVDLHWASTPGALAQADLVIIPGSRATVSDLQWLRDRGLDAALRRIADDPQGPHMLGVCAGYQMMGQMIDDQVESGAGRVPGLGLLPVSTTFTAPKIVRRAAGRILDGPAVPVAGYEIRWGRPVPTDGASAWLELEAWQTAGDLDATRREGTGCEGTGPEGCRSPDGRIRGTSLHGILDGDRLRHTLLTQVAATRGRSFDASPVPYAQALDAHLDHLAEWVEDHLDVPRLLELAGTATPLDEEPGW